MVLKNKLMTRKNQLDRLTIATFLLLKILNLKIRFGCALCDCEMKANSVTQEFEVSSRVMTF